ncbi:hypothetical protein Efla_001054 [Eimeria flavescens]
MAGASSFNPSCLQGRVALITGGGSGIGKGVAKVFLLHGAKVAILSRNINALRAAAQELQESTGGECLAVQADVRSPSQVEAAVDEVLRVYNKIDILVNNAAGNFLVSLEKLTVNGFKTVFEIDALGVFIVSKAVFHKAFQGALKGHLPGQQLNAAEGEAFSPPTEQEAAAARASSNSGKVIINMSMTLHYAATLLQTHAGAAKAAIDALTKHMAVEWGPYNVRVNGIAPGPIADTVGIDRLLLSSTTAGGNPAARSGSSGSNSAGLATGGSEGGAEAAKKGKNKSGSMDALTRFVPLQRLGHVQDVAFACLFLSLPEASYITGATLVVDGGQWMTTGNFTCLEPTINTKWRNAPFEAKL